MDPEILLLFLLLRRQFRAVLDHQSGQLTQISSPEIPVPRLGREQRTETFSRHILQTPCPNNNQLHQQVSYYEIKHLTLHICSSKLVYRFLMPLMQDLLGCDHQGLYEIPDSYIIPFLATPSQGGGRRWNISLKDFKILTQIIRKMHRLTPDSLTSLLLRKLNDSIDDRFIKILSTFIITILSGLWLLSLVWIRHKSAEYWRD